ncbi:LppU/SCO3897 family protein [Actinomycetota bacterium Odt1-20B]
MTTPPPHGQNPYPPQGQNPYGQPQGGVPYGQQAPTAPYPAQQGQPGMPQQPYQQFPQGGPVPPPAPARPRRSFKTYLRAGAVVLGLIALGVGWLASRDDAETAAVGDCMHRGSSDDSHPDLEVVGCDDSKAQYKVLAKIEGTYTGLLADSKCKAEAKDFQYAYTQSGKGTDFVLCLKDYKQ